MRIFIFYCKTLLAQTCITRLFLKFSSCKDRTPARRDHVNTHLVAHSSVLCFSSFIKMDILFWQGDESSCVNSKGMCCLKQQEYWKMIVYQVGPACKIQDGGTRGQNTYILCYKNAVSCSSCLRIGSKFIRSTFMGKRNIQQRFWAYIWVNFGKKTRNYPPINVRMKWSFGPFERFIARNTLPRKRLPSEMVSYIWNKRS